METWGKLKGEGERALQGWDSHVLGDLGWVAMWAGAQGVAQCYVVTLRGLPWMGGGFRGEWIHVYGWLSPFVINIVNWLYPNTKQKSQQKKKEGDLGGWIMWAHPRSHGCIVSFRLVFCVYWICSKRGTSWSYSIHSLAVSPGRTIGDGAGGLCSFTEAVRPAAETEPGLQTARRNSCKLGDGDCPTGQMEDF